MGQGARKARSGPLLGGTTGKPLTPTLGDWTGCLPSCSSLESSGHPRAQSPSAPPCWLWPPSRPAWPLAPAPLTSSEGGHGAHPHRRPFLAPKELGVLPARVRGSQLGINSSAGGGDQDFHSQSLEASHPGQAGPPSCCPLVLHWLPTIPAS